MNYEQNSRKSKFPHFRHFFLYKILKPHQLYLDCYIISKLFSIFFQSFQLSNKVTRYLTAGCLVVNWERPEIPESCGPGRPPQTRCPGFNSRSSRLDRPAQGYTALSYTRLQLWLGLSQTNWLRRALQLQWLLLDYCFCALFLDIFYL